RLETPPADGEPLTISGHLNTAMAKLPVFNSPDESQADFQSSEWRARMRKQKNFGLVVNPGGSFGVHSVPPGPYTQRLSAFPPGGGPYGIRAGGAAGAAHSKTCRTFGSAW